MRMFMSLSAVMCGLVLLLSGANYAQDKKDDKKKEVKLDGLVACNKCELSKSTECETIIVVTDEKKKDTIYFFDAASHKKFHDDICAGAKKGTVTGFVKDVEKKKIINVTKVEYK
jgi:hypothetical protein